MILYHNIFKTRSFHNVEFPSVPRILTILAPAIFRMFQGSKLEPDFSACLPLPPEFHTGKMYTNTEIRQHKTSYNILKTISILLALSFCTACATSSISKTGTSFTKPTDSRETLDNTYANHLSHIAKSTDMRNNKTDPATLTDPDDITDQDMLDSALDLCQTSNDSWEHGNLDNALNTLDNAFSLILRVRSENPDILQQKDDLRFTIAKRIVEVYSSRFTTANGFQKAIPLDMNNHVKKALSLFTGQEKSFFIAAYKRSGRYRPFIVTALKKAGLPEELSWLPLIESGFKVHAFSKARALGLWQFIASTGYKFGLKRDLWVDERMDPEKSTYAAIAYLKELHRIFGDWTTALAAYNCGEGTVLKCIRKQKINYLDNFWDLYTILPVETSFYVPKFLAVLHILKNPKAYGIELPPTDKPIQAETVSVNKQVSLKLMAKKIGVQYSLLKKLNPQLRHNCTPNRPFSLRVPAGKGQVLLAKIKDIPIWHPPVPVYIRHRIKRGESLSTLARRYHTNVRSIMVMNRLRSSHIRAGHTLKIPVGKRYYRFSKTRRRFPRRGMKKRLVKYVVKRGDSLWKIAAKFGTTTKIIRRLNYLKSNYLKAGQTLLVPKAAKERKA